MSLRSSCIQPIRGTYRASVLSTLRDEVEEGAVPTPVGVYLRISDDYQENESEKGKGVGRQRADCLTLVRVRRWIVGKAYEDNDVSAYRRGVVREDFEQMLNDLRLGVIKGVVVYNLDRLARQPKDLERLIDIYDDHPEYVFATLEGDINLATSDGRTMARVMVAFANKASADTGRRVARVQMELARQGKHHGGAPVSFGWMADRVTVDPAAKAEIDRAHDRVLAGEKIAGIQADWSERGIFPLSRKTGRTAGKIHHSTVKRLLTNPALAGLKVYRGEVVVGDDGEPIKAAWDPICTRERLELVIAALEERTPQNRAPGGNALKYLLSGIALCGACGGPMRGSLRSRNGKAHPGYLCNNSGKGAGCGKVVRAMEPVDRLVIDLVLAEERRREGARRPLPPWEGEDELTSIQAEIAELVTAKKEGRISVATLIQLVPDLEKRRDELLFAKRRLLLEVRRSEVVGAKSRDEFDALPLDRQRGLVLRSLRAVVIHPNGKGNKRFNPDLIEPIWA